MGKFLVLPIALVVSYSLIDAADEHRLLIHRIGPSSAALYTAQADGSGERTLLTEAALDYNASLSSDGQWIVFTRRATSAATRRSVRPVSPAEGRCRRDE